MPESDASLAPPLRPASPYDATRDEKGFWATLSDFFMPDEDRYTYAEAMHRGSIMVSVTVDEAQATRAEDILEKHGTVNIDEREATWRKEGWKGYDSSTADGDRLPVIEEQLKVGKRQVSGGRVKVRSYVVETPVKEQVTLRDETVSIERRPLDRALTEGEAGRMFQDRTIVAEERGEEAVMSKTARVTGRGRRQKDVEQRTETVSDTVRSTKVDVADERTGRSKADPKVAKRR